MRIDHRDVPDAAALKLAEQSGVWWEGVHGEADNGVALSVVGAVEWCRVVIFGLAANRLEVADAAHVDVVRLLEGLAAGVVAAVDVGGEVNEVLRVVDFVVAARRVVRQAADGILRPCRLCGHRAARRVAPSPEAQGAKKKFLLIVVMVIQILYIFIFVCKITQNELDRACFREQLCRISL